MENSELATREGVPGAIQMQENNALVTYTNASMLKISDEEQKLLQSSVDPNEVEIRPDGLLYLPQVFVRDKLNRVFGIGQWALLQHATPKDPDKDKLYFDGSLYVRGCFAARAVGEAEYHAENPLQSWASVYESAKSDCLVRCCKDLGIAKELWMPAFGRDWQKKFAVKVWREKTNNKTGGKGVFQWRRKDVDPFYDEKGGGTGQAEQSSQENPAPQSKPVSSQGAEFKTFDPMVEQIGFGKYQGIEWGKIDTGYLQWLVGNGRPEAKQRAEATLKALDAVHAQKDAGPPVIDSMFPNEPKLGERETAGFIDAIKAAKSLNSLALLDDKAIAKWNGGEITNAQKEEIAKASSFRQSELTKEAK
jgi:hypothetical protein